MSRKSPDIVIEEIFPKPEEARYPSLKAAQEAARPGLGADLVEVLKVMLKDGHLVNIDGKIVPNSEKIEADRITEFHREKFEKENRKVFIYALIDPRNDEIKYIGRALYLKTRYKQHVTSTASSPLVKEWIKELKTIGKKPNIKVIAETIEIEANALEKKMIEEYSKTYELLNTIHMDEKSRRTQRREDR